MKKLLFLLLMFPILAFAQTSTSEGEILKSIFPFKEGKIFYSETIDSLKMSQSEIYSIAKMFVVDEFKSTKDAIQDDSREDGRIVVKELFEVPEFLFIPLTENESIEYSLRIRCKDGKTNIEFYDFRYNGYSPASKYYNELKSNISLEQKFSDDSKISKGLVTLLNMVDRNVKIQIKDFKASLAKGIDDDF